MLYINNIALPEDQQSVIVNNVAAEKVYCNNELVWEYAPYPTCPGYTLYGDYFLSDTVGDYEYYQIDNTVNNGALGPISENVTVILGNQTKSATAKILSVEELCHLTPEQRKMSNGDWWWTADKVISELGSGSTSSKYIIVDNNGSFTTSDDGTYDYGEDDGYDGYIKYESVVRLGFKNPFIQAGNYELYGDYYLEPIVNSGTNYYSWHTACEIEKTVTISNGHKTKTVTAKTLSKEELETLTMEQRRTPYSYWTSTSDYVATSSWENSSAFIVNDSGDFESRNVDYDDNENIECTFHVRTGFKNPFLK